MSEQAPETSKITLEEVASYKLQEEYELGFFEPGWDLEEYIQAAVDKMGWECIPIWGIKGSKKSNRLMSILYKVYGDWEEVHRHIVITPMDFLNLINDESADRIPAIGWDDITAYLDAQLYFEDRDLYIQIKRSWALTRTKMSVFLYTLPVKTDVCGFIQRDITSEIFCSPRQTINYDRWAWKMDPSDPLKVTKRAINVHNKRGFDMYEVPTEEFQRYWKRRLELAKIGREVMTKAFNKAFQEAPEMPSADAGAIKAASDLMRQKRKEKRGY